MKPGWKMVKLGEVAKITSGGTPSRKKSEYYAGGYIPWVKTGDLKTKYVVNTQESITELGLKNSSAKLFPARTVLIALYGATIGNCSILKLESATNQACGAILPANELIPEYLYAFLCAQKERFVSLGVGGAQPNISGAILKNTRIPLPPLGEQRRIVEVLDAAQALIDRRKEQIALMDQLVQSLFYDMFGDPVTNPMGWDQREVHECCESKKDIKCGPFGTQLQAHEFTTSGVPLWGIKHVNKHFQLQTGEFLSSEKAKQLEQYSIVKDDLVMTRKGTIGNCAVYPAYLPLGIMHSDLLRLRIDKKKACPIFIKNQFHESRDITRQLSMISQGAVMAGINVSKLKNLKIYLPPVSLQIEFASRVEAIEVQKASMVSALQEQEDLFAALMQRAFKGELELGNNE